MKKLFLILCVGVSALAQEKKELKIDFSGYLEVYYAFDFSHPTAQQKLPFMYNYNRHNEFNVNLGLLRAKVEYDNVYGSFAIHSGTYVEDNYANETTKIINEAYLGIYLDKNKKSTVEVGILPSYIGFETATSASNLTLTRSLLAENSPYFMTGIKYSYKPNDKWMLAGLLTNGWQRINKPNKNNAPALGSQVVYKPSEKSVFNWSTFMGKELYNNHFAMRYFSNLYWDNTWNSKWRTIVGFDYGLQKDAVNEENLTWMSPVIMAQYSLSSKWQMAFRTEYYQDEDNVLIASNTQFKTLGFSLNMDYLINDKVKLRTEARYFRSDEAGFIESNNLLNQNFFLTSSLSFEF